MINEFDLDYIERTNSIFYYEIKKGIVFTFARMLVIPETTQ